MLVWGSSMRVIDLGNIGREHCARCGGEREFHRIVRYAWNHVWVVFCWISGKRYFDSCRVCGTARPVDAATAEATLAKPVIPVFERRGWLMSLVVGALLISPLVLSMALAPKPRNIPELVERARRGDVAALEALRTEARAGDLPSQIALGDLLTDDGNGDHVVDLAEAFRWTLAAAESGDVNAQLVSGYRYQLGYGVEADATKAAHWFEQAAKQGSAAAANELAVALDDGVGVPKDSEGAMRWFRRAAEGHDRAGTFNLGMHLLKDADASTMPEVVHLLEIAAAADGSGNDAIAGMAGDMLGQLYENGDRVERDLLRALNWYQAAAASNEHAKASVERLSALMSR